jgi:N-acetylglucosaminyldiphosphoundecaprenol N-acetyl-beta-D-mannosaminyltransferase
MAAEPQPCSEPPRASFAVGTVLGTPLQCTSYEQLTRFCQWRARQPGVVAIDFTNTHIVTMRRHDPHFREITSRFDYFVPDATPLIWVLNRRGAAMRDRVYGPSFMRHCVLGSPAPITHYFLGGSNDCLEKLQANFRRENPHLQIVGVRNGYFGRDAEEGIIAEIDRLSPDFVWVGLGTPKQQDFIYRHKDRFARGILFAVGFAFDVNAGTKPDAPPWMQRLGLTWLFRLLSEPRRLGPRYVKWNSLFLASLAAETLTGRAERVRRTSG